MFWVSVENLDLLLFGEGIVIETGGESVAEVRYDGKGGR